MASGTIVGTKYISGGHFWIELRWTDAIVSTTTSSVTVKTYFCSDWAVNFTATKNGNTTVNGSSLDWSSGTDVNHGNSYAETLVYTRSGVSVTHNADGTKSITISGNYVPNVTITGYGTLGTMTASGTAVLSDTNGTEYIPNMWVWNGSAWVREKHLYIWDGGAWVHGSGAGLKAWNGTSWVNTK